MALTPLRGEMVARRTASPDWSASGSHVGFEEQRVLSGMSLMERMIRP